MSSLLPGFEYDIFISYRQKDNKGDRWVTKFVDALRLELEATLKEDVSIYFDENPHDGLLETHQVNKSLEGKLKCVIFIPIVSQTYCDPKSYAWEHELCAFNRLSKGDQLGREVKLANGNVSSRILPVKIHNLDPGDRKILEDELGDVLRAVEFIYREPGVNRPLTVDDNAAENLNKTKFRNQVNKVANAIKEILQAAKVDVGGVQEIQQTQTERSLENVPPVTHIDTVPEDARDTGSGLKRPLMVLGGFALVIIIAASTWYVNRHSKIRWAREQALPEIKRLLSESDFDRNLVVPYRLAVEAEKYIEGDPELTRAIDQCSFKINVTTEPAGASVYLKEYDKPDSEWQFLGMSPLDSVRVPISMARWKVEKDGYNTILCASTTWRIGFSKRSFSVPNHLGLTLDKSGTIPADMVRVSDPRPDSLALPDFYIDKYEVTNAQFKDFIHHGGYEEFGYWKDATGRDGKPLPLEDLISGFIDQTGRPGPSTWQAGDFPEGQADYPVTGVSWYEAAAFARYSGKSLPSYAHWNVARGAFTEFARFSAAPVMTRSNFGGKGAVPVGSLNGMSPCGAYDMAGNAREWCWNQTPEGRLIRGGDWDDPVYNFSRWNQVSPLDRSVTNGFRCSLYGDSTIFADKVFNPLSSPAPIDFRNAKPVEEIVLRAYKGQFSYDSADLQERVESVPVVSNDFALEKISINAAYGGERLVAYLFLPLNAPPPYQTVVYFPGSGAASQLSSDGIESSAEFMNSVSFFMKNGRALLWPVYKGTFERGGSGPTRAYHSGDNTHAFTEYLTQLVMDFSRSVDYLCSRKDIDKNRIGYYGLSWGAWMGTFIPAIDDRIKVSILVAGGLIGDGLPEANEINYIRHIKKPTLMLNGRYDMGFPLETSILPMFELMGTPSQDKKLLLYEADHIPPRNEIVKESLSWLDHYLGPVTLRDKRAGKELNKRSN